MSFILTIVTPTGKFFEGEALSLDAPGEIGPLTILTDHAPIVAGLKKGKLTVTPKSRQDKLTLDITGGVLEVDPQHQAVVLVS